MTEANLTRAEQMWENVFSPYRTRILYPIAVVGSAIFLPLAVFDFMRGRLAISATLLCLVAMLLADAVALYRKKSPPIPFAFLLLPGYVGVCMSLATQGIYGAFWSFAVVFLSFFALRRRIANCASVALLIVGGVLTAMTQEPGTTVRYVLSLALCLVVINIMLSVLEALHARLLEQSITDPLTGAYNRRQMDANLEETIERFRRTGAPASALVIDVDHFKRINDRHGHDAGDEVLKGIVRLIQERCRKLDGLFRQGGEEFVLLLPDTRVGEAMVVAENLRRAVAEAKLLPGESVTVSVGVGEVRIRDYAKQWIKRVDGALYRAKEAGRNRVACADMRSIDSLESSRKRRSA